jgi:endonuclease-3
VRRLRDRLREIYGTPDAPPHQRPLDELILTVLSQSTNDRNRDVAFLALRRSLPGRNWEAVRDADWHGARCAPARPSRRRSARAASRKVKSVAHPGDPARDRRAAQPRLDGRAPVAESRAALCALPGVGRKTAACVLLFSFGLRDVPVDTHVSRVGTRLGLLRPGAPFEELHDSDARADSPRRGARAPPQPAAPRPAHLLRPRARVPGLRVASDVPPGWGVVGRRVRALHDVSARGLPVADEPMHVGLN